MSINKKERIERELRRLYFFIDLTEVALEGLEVYLTENSQNYNFYVPDENEKKGFKKLKHDYFIKKIFKIIYDLNRKKIEKLEEESNNKELIRVFFDLSSSYKILMYNTFAIPLSKTKKMLSDSEIEENLDKFYTEVNKILDTYCEKVERINLDENEENEE